MRECSKINNIDRRSIGKSSNTGSSHSTARDVQTATANEHVRM